jgi:hypothetical protein
MDKRDRFANDTDLAIQNFVYQPLRTPPKTELFKGAKKTQNEILGRAQ